VSSSVTDASLAPINKTYATETGQFDLYQTPKVTSFEANVDKKAGGKIRTKISESTRSSQKVCGAEDVPKPAFIASHNAPLPLKSLPVISYHTESKTAVTTSSNSFLKGYTNSNSAAASTTATVAADKPTVSLPSLVSDLKKSNKSFTFAVPSPVKVQLGPDIQEDGNGVAQFSFCLPEEVVGSSFLSKETSPVLSSTTDISTYNKLPDITAQMSHTKNPMTLRTGSVMDVLGQNNALPDVTASAGVKVATSLRSESVMSFLGRH